MSESERDRAVDAAWRAASREEPPAALDEAVRAEARRAAGAAPGGVRRRHAWRYPAAAAATVALLAFGIAQMTSRDEIEPMAVSDQAPAAGNAPSSAPGKEARRDEERASANKVARPSAPAAPPAATRVSGLDEIKAKQAGAESVAAWIARIRDLKARGELDAAAKDLAAFRTAYGERADALLPPDLRAVAPEKER